MLKLAKENSPTEYSAFSAFKGGCLFPFYGMKIRLIVFSGKVTIHIASNPNTKALQQLFKEIDLVASKYEVNLEAIQAHCFYQECLIADQATLNVVIPLPVASINSVAVFYCNDCKGKYFSDYPNS